MVDLLCTLCTRIRTYPDLLLIFLHDKNWYNPPTPIKLDDDEDEDTEVTPPLSQNQLRSASPTPSNASTITSAPSAATPRKPEYEFLILNYLLRFVHREGKIGDLARGGIISLIDVAMTAGEGEKPRRVSDGASSASDPVGEAALALAEYMLDGDFCDVLCAGLGAVYSELPTKLEVRHDDNDILGGAMVLGGLTDEARGRREQEDIAKAQRAGIVFSTDPLFRARLDHFLKLLEFVQDVLLRISGRMDDPLRASLAPAILVGSAVAQSLMDTFRTTFLKNVLYPSLLECSETDGSSVAVMMYIDEMLRSLSEASLTDLILAFLMSEEDDDGHARPRKYRAERVLDGRRLKTSKKVKRKSSAMILLEAVKPEDPNYFSSLGRFTLKDLIMSNIRSPTQAAATAALRLLRSLFKNHCHLTVDRLITVARDPRATNFGSRKLQLDKLSCLRPDSPVSNDEFVYPGTSPKTTRHLSLVHEPETTVFDHDREVRMYLDLVNRVAPSRQRDTVDRTDDDAAFSTGFENYMSDAVATIEEESCFVDDDESVLSMPRHRLVPTDALLGALLQSLRLFFSHAPEQNVQLTGVLVAISACPHRSIAGWLMQASQDDVDVEWPEETKEEEDEISDNDDRSIDYGINELLRSGRKPSKRPQKNENRHLPVIYVIMCGLVGQLDRYRQTVDAFDGYLEERRRGLLFTENMSDALNLHFELSADATAARASIGVRAVPSPPPNTPAKAKNRLASVTQFFTPSKKQSKPSAPRLSGQHPQTPAKSNRDPSTMPTTPFSPHYKQTSAIDVEPYVAPGPTAGPWSPASIGAGDSRQSLVFSSFEDEADVFSASSGTKNVGLELRAAATVSLSQLLDNVVILEEAIKELAAILQVRRSIGIDSLRYV